jgi:C-terminal processing protease CtpA/Prc
VLSGGGTTERAPLTGPDLTPSPPVAVIIGGQTASSGEVVAVAFRGRAQTRSFGSQTYGATTGAGWYRLIDGAELVLGSSFYVDRDGVVYKHAVDPDVEVSMLGSGDPQMRAAKAWLLARPGCTRRL